MEYVSLAVSIIAMVTIATALIVTINNFKKQLQLNFFADYTKRYQEIMLQFPEKINEEDFKISKLSEKESDHTLRHMRAYFDLCSEEYYLWKKGNIDNETWEEWQTGIKFAFSKSAFKEAWEILNLDTIYYSSFSEFVKESIK
jgi:hypothetical protein